MFWRFARMRCVQSDWIRLRWLMKRLVKESDDYVRRLQDKARQPTWLYFRNINLLCLGMTCEKCRNVTVCKVWNLKLRQSLWLLSSSFGSHRVSYLFAHCSLRNESENNLFNSVNEIPIPPEKKSMFSYLKQFRPLTPSCQLLCKSKRGLQPTQNRVFDMSWKLLFLD
jgi:hypothetical protein